MFQQIGFNQFFILQIVYFAKPADGEWARRLWRETKINGK